MAHYPEYLDAEARLLLGEYRERFRVEDLVVSGDLESVIAFAEAANPAPMDLLARLHARFDPVLPPIAPPMTPALVVAWCRRGGAMGRPRMARRDSR